MLINTISLFQELDERRERAEVTLRGYSVEERAEASRVALIHDRCAVSSVKHLEDTARFAISIYGER